MLKRDRRMSATAPRCVLLADRHHGLSEGVRGLLESAFDTVFIVADETSLFEGALRLQPRLVVADLAFTLGDALGFVRRLHARAPQVKLLLLTVHDQSSVARAVIAAGADGVVLKRAIATDLLDGVDRLLAGENYLSPGLSDHHDIDDRDLH